MPRFNVRRRMTFQESSTYVSKAVPAIVVEGNGIRFVIDDAGPAADRRKVSYAAVDPVVAAIKREHRRTRSCSSAQT